MYTETPRAHGKKGEGGGVAEEKYILNSLALKTKSEFLPQYKPTNPKDPWPWLTRVIMSSETHTANDTTLTIV